MKEITTLVFFLILLVQTQAQITSINKEPFSIGESLTFFSKTLNEERKLNIYLPNNYSKDSARSYPVIYLLDGSKDEDFIHVAGLVQFCSFSWINIVPESIVVGISNVDRKRDFTYPTNNAQDKKDFPTTGGSAKFIQFIQEELQPLIRKEYATNDTSTLIGQSLGGLLATEILLHHSGTFDNYLIISPSLWWDDESLLGLADERFKTNKNVYIAVGKEGPIMERTAQELYVKLMKASPKHPNLYYHFLAEQDHGDALHLAVYDAFERLFKQKK